jgi:hypothetical protein
MVFVGPFVLSVVILVGARLEPLAIMHVIDIVAVQVVLHFLLSSLSFCAVCHGG